MLYVCVCKTRVQFIICKTCMRVVLTLVLLSSGCIGNRGFIQELGRKTERWRGEKLIQEAVSESSHSHDHVHHAMTVQVHINV